MVFVVTSFIGNSPVIDLGEMPGLKVYNRALSPVYQPILLYFNQFIGLFLII